MEENKNPFIKKDYNSEIEDILNEAQLVPDTPPEKVNGIKLSKKIKLPKRKTMIYGAIAIIILILGLTFLNTPCDSSNNQENCSLNPNDNTEFISSLKQQIITKGYAEVTDGISILKLAPYIK